MGPRTPRRRTRDPSQALRREHGPPPVTAPTPQSPPARPPTSSRASRSSDPDRSRARPRRSDRAGRRRSGAGHRPGWRPAGWVTLRSVLDGPLETVGAPTDPQGVSSNGRGRGSVFGTTTSRGRPGAGQPRACKGSVGRTSRVGGEPSVTFSPRRSSRSRWRLRGGWCRRGPRGQEPWFHLAWPIRYMLVVEHREAALQEVGRVQTGHDGEPDGLGLTRAISWVSQPTGRTSATQDLPPACTGANPSSAARVQRWRPPPSRSERGKSGHSSLRGPREGSPPGNRSGDGDRGSPEHRRSALGSRQSRNPRPPPLIQICSRSSTEAST